MLRWMTIVFLVALTTIFGNSFPLFASSESPYKLPYPAGKEYKVSQGNFGSSSHNNPKDPRPIYAFDFNLSGGHSVVASRSGKVLSVQDKFGRGGQNTDSNKVNYVLIDHKDGTSALYLHLQKDTIVVKESEKVKQGQIIGKADSSGYVTGPHLHFQVQVTPKKIYHNSSVGYNRGWYTQSIQISFSDKDVLAKEPDGIPKKGKSYISDNYPPTPTPTVTPTPTPIPTATSIPQPTPTLSVPSVPSGLDSSLWEFARQMDRALTDNDIEFLIQRTHFQKRSCGDLIKYDVPQCQNLPPQILLDVVEHVAGPLTLTDYREWLGRLLPRKLYAVYSVPPGLLSIDLEVNPKEPIAITVGFDLVKIEDNWYIEEVGGQLVMLPDLEKYLQSKDCYQRDRLYICP